MSRKVENKQEAYIKLDVVEKHLNQKNWKINDLHDELQQRYQIDIGYKQFAKLMKNSTNWRLTYAFVLCDLFNLRIDELFQLEEKKC
ncbi:helix-turn-helix domain-containing protein [Paenibacillus sp. FSL R7-0302]|uniref:helix-turn-helix domain-containing protein n=1 Tax=Paenibacillus sp. FSL R7-0302 TaxID=2921681 RepID=UPI0030F85B88